MYVTARQRQIIEQLLEHREGMTVKEIAAKINVSSRTIHRDLQHIENILHKFDLTLQKQAGVGLQLSGRKEKKEALTAALTELKPTDYTNEERQKLLLSILLQQKEPVKLFTLATELNVTIATVSNDLDQLAQWLTPFQLKIIRKRSYGVEIQGDEAQKRSALRQLITIELSEDQLFSILESVRKNQAIEVQASQQLLSLLDTQVIREVLLTLQSLRREEEPIADASIIGLVVHLSLAIDRIQKGERITMDGRNMEQLKKEKEFQVATRLVKQLEEQLQITIPEAEIGYVTMHLLGAKQESQNILLPQESVLDLAWKTKQFIRKVEERVQLPLSADTSLFEGLLSHLKPALFRVEQGMKIYNSLLPKIKRDYAHLFQLLQQTILEVFNEWDLPDEEIGYLVMHFGSAIERAKKTNTVHAIIVCSSGIGTSKLLATRLEKEVPEIGTISHQSVFELNEESLSDQTLIISTVPLPSVDHYFLVNPFLSEKEVDDIRRFIRNNPSFYDKHHDGQVRKEGQMNGPKSGVLPPFENKEVALHDFQATQEASGFIYAILRHFEVQQWPAYTTSVQIMNELCQYQQDRGWITDKQEVAQALLQREQSGGLAIPGTSLALFHTRDDNILAPTFTIHELAQPVMLRGMDQQETNVERILLMLAPKDLSEQGMKLLSYISALIIESDDSIQLFERENEAAIFSFLTNKCQQFLNQQLHL